MTRHSGSVWADRWLHVSNASILVRILPLRPQSRLGRVSKDGSFESDDLMFWDVRPGLCRDVVPLAHESF
jgi:hypothetical protein